MYFIWEGAEKVFPLRRIWEGFYWCRTYTPFEKELRRYFHLRRLNIFQHFDLRRHWEGFLFEKDLRSMELLQSSWDGFEKVRWIWEGNVPSQKNSRGCILNYQWEGKISKPLQHSWFFRQRKNTYQVNKSYNLNLSFRTVLISIL